MKYDACICSRCERTDNSYDPTTIGVGDRWWYLCDDCMDEFKKWWNSGVSRLSGGTKPSKPIVKALPVAKVNKRSPK